MIVIMHLDTFEKIASILGNIGIFSITAYGFWLRYFSKNIKITSIGENHSKFFGSYIGCTIMNKTLSPLVIGKIQVVSNNQYEFTVKEYKETPLVLEPFRAYNIVGDKYSSISNSIDIFGDFYFKLHTLEKVLFIKCRGKIKKKARLNIVSRRVKSFNGVIISDKVKYILAYWKKGLSERHYVYITDGGFMDKQLENFNALPKEILGNSKEMVDVFKKVFHDKEWCFRLNELDW